MYRVEIIANQSVQDDIIETLEENIPDFLYTLIPTSSWPEVNFALFAYIEKKDAGKVKAVIKAVKKQFPDEGVKVFFVKAKKLEKI